MTSRPARTSLLLAASCFLFALLLTSAAAADDQIGIFWDTGFSDNDAEIPEGDLPAMRTGYLVLKNPSSQTGILGWECLVQIEGAGEILSWQLEGDAINVQTPPEFQVGIGGDPLPATPGGILLATFRVYVTGYSPVTLSLVPPYLPSIAGEMAFIPADDPNLLLRMGTVTGNPEVAWFNASTPLPVFTPTSLDFGTLPVGHWVTRYVEIRNDGGGIIPVDAAILEDCPGIQIINNPGPVSLAGGQSVTLTIRYHPLAVGATNCGIDLGPTLEPYPVSGIAREAVTSWTVTPALDFETVVIGQEKTMTVAIENTGETYLPLMPALPAEEQDFEITSYIPPGGFDLNYGQRVRVLVKFSPTVEATHDFLMDLGEVLPDVPISGAGRPQQMSWQVSPVSLEFADIPAGTLGERQFTVTNTGELDIELDFAFSDSTQGFWLYGSTTGYTLPPGLSTTRTVRFSSPVPGIFQTQLTLGDPLPAVDLLANVPFGSEPCLLTPPVFDFGNVTVGETYLRDFHVTNQQSQPLNLDPFTLLEYVEIQGGPVTLLYGESMLYRVALTPTGAGQIAGEIDLGEGLCEPLRILAMAEEPSCFVNTGPLDFGLVAVGVRHMREIQLQNPYLTPITLDPVSDSSHFTVPSGLITLMPRESITLQVELLAPTAGAYEGTIDLGTAMCGPLVCLAEAHESSCGVSTALLEFGEIPIGTVGTRLVDVTNDGVVALTVSPTIDGPHFWVGEEVEYLAPGESTSIRVFFQPTVPGSFQATLDLGPTFCQAVTLTGTGTMIVGTTPDQIGLFFNTSYNQVEWITTEGSGEIVTSYLVLSDPSNLTGFLAWECRAWIEGNAFIIDWALEGNFINVGDEAVGEFIVGLAEPLPWSPHVLLGTAQIITFIGAQETVLLSLGPIQDPSLPGSMAWVAPDDPGLLIPMVTGTDSPVVALIAGSYATPVQMPAPSANQTSGAVHLTWSLTQMPGDGCHVYRRDPDGKKERLTASPVVPEGLEFRFVDRPFGYADGSSLAYSYTTVTDGVEGAHSLESEVRLSGVPAVRTRLLANVPNPFNPSTEVRFELDRPQQVRVAVFDLSGRHIRTLANGNLGAGPHERVWDGLDDNGRQAPSGAYYVRLVTDSRVDHRKMMLLK